MGHDCVLMMVSGVPTKFFLWWELQVLKMRGRLEVLGGSVRILFKSVLWHLLSVLMSPQPWRVNTANPVSLSWFYWTVFAAEWTD